METFLASWIYYRKASEDLRREAAGLRRYNVMLLHFLDDAGVIDVEWDPAMGEPRRVVPITLTATAKGVASMDMKVIRREDHEAKATGKVTHEAKVIRCEDREAKPPAEEGEDR